MTETSKGLTIRGRDLGIILAFASIIIGGIVDSALTRAKVAELERIQQQYPSMVMYERQSTMARDIGEIKTDVKSMIKSMNNYLTTHQ